MKSAIDLGSVPLAPGVTSAIASNTTVSARLQDSNILRSTGLPVQPVNCTLKPETQPRT